LERQRGGELPVGYKPRGNKLKKLAGEVGKKHPNKKKKKQKEGGGIGSEIRGERRRETVRLRHHRMGGGVTQVCP